MTLYENDRTPVHHSLLSPSVSWYSIKYQLDGLRQYRLSDLYKVVTSTIEWPHQNLIQRPLVTNRTHINTESEPAALIAYSINKMVLHRWV